MAKRFFLNEWKVPPPNPSPDARRAEQLRRLRENLPPHLPPIRLKAADENGETGGAPRQSRVAARGLASLTRSQREEGKMRRILGGSTHYSPQEDPDLSLYDDLGVPRTATPEEIRQAHRALARLLHPDRITDEYTRRLAENTLKRINAAFAVLIDPAHREAYDRQLGQAGGAAALASRAVEASLGAALQAWLAKRANGAWLRRNLIWMCGTLAGLAIIYWILGTGSPEARRASAPMPAAPVPQAVIARESPARKQAEPVVRAASVAPRGAVAVADSLPNVQEQTPNEAAVETRRGTSRKPTANRDTLSTRARIEAPRAPVRHPALIAPPEIHRPQAELLPPPPDISAQTEPAPPPLEKPTLDGLWVYLRPAQRPRTNSTYPPEFIELTLREVNGILRGRYAARYQVADRPISPDVRFQFEGGATASTPAIFQWTGNGGSRGEATPRPRSS